MKHELCHVATCPELDCQEFQATFEGEKNVMQHAELIGSRFVLIIEHSGKKKPFTGTLCDLRSDRDQPLGQFSNKAALRATANAWAAMKGG